MCTSFAVCRALLLVGYQLILPICLRVTSLTLVQPYDFPIELPQCQSETALKNMCKCTTRNHYWLITTTKQSTSNPCALRWRHNDHAGVSNHQPHGCLLNRLFRRNSKKTSKLRVTGLCAGNSPGTGEFPAQMASYAENVSIWWRHHGVFHGIYWHIGGLTQDFVIPLLTHWSYRSLALSHRYMEIFRAYAQSVVAACCLLGVRQLLPQL